MRDKTMTDKSKRKINPRRRLLIRLIFSIGVFVAMIASGVYLLRPKGAQIVFIAPDDEGINQIWLADLNNPENARQLTEFTKRRVWYMESSEMSNVLFFITDEAPHSTISFDDIWMIEINSSRIEHVLSCDETSVCTLSDIHPAGHLLAYTEYEYGTVHIHIYNREDGDNRIVYTANDISPLRASRFQSVWIGNSETLFFHIREVSEADVDAGMFHNYVDDTLTVSPTFIGYSPRFSDDGTHIAHYLPVYNSVGNHLSISENHETILELEELLLLWFHDWHPDNETILVTRSGLRINGANEEEGFVALNLYNLDDGTYETLLTEKLGSFAWSPTFNYDASMFLYTYGSYSHGARIDQLMLYDMEAGEEIPLPLFGSNPQWVNGGR